MAIKKLKYFIGSVGFVTKGEIKPYVKERLCVKGYGEVYTTDDIFELIHDILKLHIKYEKKIGSGIKSFSIEPNAMTQRDYTIVINRTDGTRENFSWVDCIEGQKNKSTLLSDAMREAISIYTYEYKKSQKLYCRECGENNLEAQDFHVDHNTVPFRKLKEDFLNSTTLSIPDDFTKNNLNMTKFKEENSQFCNKWIEYHNSIVDYQILCSKCNSRKH